MVRTIFITTSLLALSLLRGGADTNAPFSIQQREGISWLTRPNGERFFSLGVCVVNQGASREQFSSTNPGYAAFQHYENSNRWAEATLQAAQVVEIHHRWRLERLSGFAAMP